MTTQRYDSAFSPFSEKRKIDFGEVGTQKRHLRRIARKFISWRGRFWDDRRAPTRESRQKFHLIARRAKSVSTCDQNHCGSARPGLDSIEIRQRWAKSGHHHLPFLMIAIVVASDWPTFEVLSHPKRINPCSN
jgi:hypothetical protein